MMESPILYTGSMVRAILDGRKTQTRRAAKLNISGRLGRLSSQWHPENPGAVVACPYGQPGDRLWCRETWGCKDADRPGAENGRNPQPGDSIQYAANDADAWQWRVPGALPWRPSIHMPRWASRITLEITDVRVQRVQDISEADALAEGCRSAIRNSAAFADLWDSINAKRGFGWNTNPWVWALTFKRVEE